MKNFYWWLRFYFVFALADSYTVSDDLIWSVHFILLLNILWIYVCRQNFLPSNERKCWNIVSCYSFDSSQSLCWHPVRCVHSHYPHVSLTRAVWNQALLVTHIVVARTEPCLTTLMKHFEWTETHIDVTQRSRYEETLQVYRSLGYAADVLTVSQYLPYSPQRITVHHICCLCDTEKLHDTSAVAHDLLQHFHRDVLACLKALFPGNWIGREGPIP